MELLYPLWSDAPEPRLIASRHRETNEWVFPAVPESSPLAALHDNLEIESTGEVYSFTVIHPGKKSGEEPYALGFVDLPGPVRIFGRLTGSARPTIGQTYVARPDETYGYVFKAVQA